MMLTPLEVEESKVPQNHNALKIGRLKIISWLILLQILNIHTLVIGESS